MMRVGLLGCGNIGHLIASHAEHFEIVALYDQDLDRARELATVTGGTAYDSFEAFVGAGAVGATAATGAAAAGVGFVAAVG